MIKNPKERKTKEIDIEKKSINDIEDKSKELNKTIEQLKESILREKAENENLRKRFKNELNNSSKYAIAKLAKETINNIEDINRALSTIKNSNHKMSSIEAKIIKGLELVNSNFSKSLAKFNIYRIFPIGEKFDFKFHEAISQVSSKEKDNIVIEVLQAGYKIDNRVLKPAQVIVSKRK